MFHFVFTVEAGGGVASSVGNGGSLSENKAEEKQ